MTARVLGVLLGTARLTWVGFPVKTLVDVSEQSRVAAEEMDFDCEMKNICSSLRRACFS